MQASSCAAWPVHGLEDSLSHAVLTQAESLPMSCSMVSSGCRFNLKLRSNVCCLMLGQACRHELTGQNREPGTASNSTDAEYPIGLGIP